MYVISAVYHSDPAALGRRSTSRRVTNMCGKIRILKAMMFLHYQNINFPAAMGVHWEGKRLDMFPKLFWHRRSATGSWCLAAVHDQMKGARLQSWLAPAVHDQGWPVSKSVTCTAALVKGRAAGLNLCRNSYVCSTRLITDHGRWMQQHDQGWGMG